MEKARIDKGFLKYPVRFKIALVLNVLAKLRKNVEFINPELPLFRIEYALEDLELTLVKAQKGGNLAIAAAHAAEKILDDLMLEQVMYIESLAKGNEKIISDFGFMITYESLPVAFMVENSKFDGEIILKHKAVSGARAWVWQYCQNPISENKWKLASVTTQCTFTITELSKGVKYWFRAAYVTTKEMSEWCEPQFKIVK